MIISIANLKGGTAKTTTVITFATLLAKMDKSVLLVDMDAQASLTNFILGIEDNALLEDQTITNSLLNGGELPLLHVDRHNVDIIPSGPVLGKAELELATMQDSIENSRVLKLRNLLAEVRDDYDYILIDCPGNLGLLSMNGIAASDYVLTVSSVGKFERSATRFFINYINNVIIKDYAPTLQHLGILLTMTDAYPITDKMKSRLKEIPELADKVLFNTIPKNNPIRNATEENTTGIAYDVYSTSSQAYMKSLDEILERIQG